MFVLIYDLRTGEEFKLTMREFYEYFGNEAPEPTCEIQEYDDFIYHKALTQAVYAIYKGDTFEDVGTFLELCARLGLSKDLVRYFSYPSNIKRAGATRRVSVRIDNLMEEE